MSRDLPADREKALAAIAAGWGRRATAAHPMCTCAPSRRMASRPVQPEADASNEAWAAWAAAHAAWEDVPCPMHP